MITFPAFSYWYWSHSFCQLSFLKIFVNTIFKSMKGIHTWEVDILEFRTVLHCLERIIRLKSNIFSFNFVWLLPKYFFPLLLFFLFPSLFFLFNEPVFIKAIPNQLLQILFFFAKNHTVNKIVIHIWYWYNTVFVYLQTRNLLIVDTVAISLH